MDRNEIVKKMAAHIDNEVMNVRYAEDWEPERIAEEVYDIVFEGYKSCSTHNKHEPSCVWCASAEHNRVSARH